MLEQETQPKPWWLSRGMWGPVISMVGSVGMAAGLGFDAGALVEATLVFVTSIGAIVGWWGRREAKQPIDKTRMLPFGK